MCILLLVSICSISKEFMVVLIVLFSSALLIQQLQQVRLTVSDWLITQWVSFLVGGLLGKKPCLVELVFSDIATKEFRSNASENRNISIVLWRQGGLGESIKNGCIQASHLTHVRKSPSCSQALVFLIPPPFLLAQDAVKESQLETNYSSPQYTNASAQIYQNWFPSPWIKILCLSFIKARRGETKPMYLHSYITGIQS